MFRDLTFSLVFFGHFYVRLFWAGFGFQANIVEEYVLLCASSSVEEDLGSSGEYKVMDLLGR